LEEIEQRMIVGGSGGGPGISTCDNYTWIPFSCNYLDFLASYVANTPDSTYVEIFVAVLKNGKTIAFKDPKATAIRSTLALIQINGSGADGKWYLPIYKDSVQYNSPVDTIIHPHKNSPVPSGTDTIAGGHFNGVKQMVYYNGNLIPFP
jgi:hypothetical protein